MENLQSNKLKSAYLADDDIYKLFEIAKTLYKTVLKFDISKLSMTITPNANVNEDGSIYKELDPEVECDGSWTYNCIVINSRYNKFMDNFELDTKEKRCEHMLGILIHECAHEVYKKHLSEKDKTNYLRKIITTKFTTNYLDEIKSEIGTIITQEEFNEEQAYKTPTYLIKSSQEYKSRKYVY